MRLVAREWLNCDEYPALSDELRGIMDWLAYKDELARLAFEKDALHIYAALAIQVAAAMITRRTLGHLLPWLAVFATELVNEVFDYLLGGEPEMRPWQVVAAVHDLINTMILPTALLLLCRHLPHLLLWKDATRTADRALRSGGQQSHVTAAAETDPP